MTTTRKIKTAPKAKTPVEKTKKKAPKMSGLTAKYAGASQPIRGHGRNLRPIVMDRVPKTFTDRDKSLLDALFAAHGQKQFERLDIDAGALSRLVGFGYIEKKAGNLDERDAKFGITSKAVSDRLSKATA